MKNKSDFDDSLTTSDSWSAEKEFPHKHAKGGVLTGKSVGTSAVVTDGRIISAGNSKFDFEVQVNIQREIDKRNNLRHNRSIIKKTAFSTDD